MVDDLVPLGTKYRIKGKLYKVTGYIVAQQTLIIMDPMEPTLLTKRLRVRPEDLAELKPE